MKKLILPILLLLILAGGYLAVRTLPWYALLALGVALVLGAKFLIKRILKSAILIPFRAKGQVLHNAQVTVHSISPTSPPPADPEDDELATNPPRNWFQVEVTIEPAPSRGPFQLWEPGDLRLVRPELASKLDDINATTDTSAIIRAVEIHDGEQFRPDEGMKYGGPQRLRLKIGAQPELHRALWSYYFEAFGEVAFPTSKQAAA